MQQRHSVGETCYFWILLLITKVLNFELSLLCHMGEWRKSFKRDAYIHSTKVDWLTVGSFWQFSCIFKFIIFVFSFYLVEMKTSNFCYSIDFKINENKNSFIKERRRLNILYYLCITYVFKGWDLLVLSRLDIIEFSEDNCAAYSRMGQKISYIRTLFSFIYKWVKYFDVF